jgi:phage/plasmid-like protein (TIGR03299 family)
MAHEIDTTTGRAAVFTVGTPPLHGLGKTVEKAVDSHEAIGLAGLDWQVEQWPVAAVAPDGRATAPADRFVANVRSDTRSVLGVVSAKYRPFQNREAFAFADAIVGEGLARYETAGGLRGGRRVWMLLRLPQELKVGNGDNLRPYLLLFNSHDASSPLRAVLTTVRVVCQNTLNLAMSQAGREGVTIRHRGELQAQVDQARVTLGLAEHRLKTFGDEAIAMKALQMTGNRLERYFDGLLPPVSPQAGEREKKNRAAAIERLHVNFADPVNAVGGMRGSLWAALNAATEYADHHRRFRGYSPAAKAESRLDSIWFGSSDDFKQAAYRAAVDLARLN